MKAVGEVHYRHEIVHDPTTIITRPLYLHNGPFVLFPDDLPTKPVPVISAWLQPVARYCPGMAYEDMEIFPGDPDFTIMVDLDVTPALIEYLYNQGETKTDILYEMARAVGWTSDM